MTTKKITLSLDSGIWEVEIYEIGNTYQLAGNKDGETVHFMIRKNIYLNYLKKKQDNQEVDKNYGLFWTGTETITPNEFIQMRKLLYENMDADLTKEKVTWDIKE